MKRGTFTGPFFQLFISAFYVPEDELAIQVSYSIEGSDKTEKREIDALQKLPKYMSCKRRIIITYDEEKIIEDDNGIIEVIPCWKWLICR